MQSLRVVDILDRLRAEKRELYRIESERHRMVEQHYDNVLHERLRVIADLEAELVNARVELYREACGLPNNL